MPAKQTGDMKSKRKDSAAGLVMQLALRDYCHEWIMSGCYVLALAAVLVPLLVLFGLKYGIISNLLDPMKQDPRYREIVPSGSGNYEPAWFTDIRRRTDIVFAAPRTRAIAASIKLQVPENETGRIIDVELIPSGPGDPVLAPDIPEPAGFNQVAISANAADKLGVSSDDHLEGIITRIRKDEQEAVTLPLEIIGVAPAGAFTRDGLFVSVELLVAVEDFRDGRAVPVLGWYGDAPHDNSRNFAGFRLYARSIDDVTHIRSELVSRGIDVRTRIADIELVKTLDRNLSIIYWIIAVITVTGYCISFGISVWANIDRKRREFSVLRLVGFRTRGIVWFPILQALLTGLLGWMLACMVFFTVQGVLNTLFIPAFGEGHPVCRLLPVHLVVTLMLTLIVAVLPAVIGGLRLAQLEPSLALRE
jgi:putative ABC transport system permease protein